MSKWMEWTTQISGQWLGGDAFWKFWVTLTRRAEITLYFWKADYFAGVQAPWQPWMPPLWVGMPVVLLSLSRVNLKQRVFRKKSRHVKEGCICFPERRALMKLTCVLPRLLLSLLLFSSPLPSLLPPFLLFSPLSSFSPFPNRDASKGEQVSQNGLPAEQGSPRVSYRSQTYQNYKNFNSRRTASDQPWSGLWSSLPFVKNHSFQILLVWPFGFHFTHSVKNFT